MMLPSHVGTVRKHDAMLERVLKLRMKIGLIEIKRSFSEQRKDVITLAMVDEAMVEVVNVEAGGWRRH